MKEVTTEVFEAVAYQDDVVSRTSYDPEGFAQNFYRDGKLVAVLEDYGTVTLWVEDI